MSDNKQNSTQSFWNRIQVSILAPTMYPVTSKLIRMNFPCRGKIQKSIHSSVVCGLSPGCRREPGDSQLLCTLRMQPFFISIYFICTYKTWGVVIFHCLSIPERFKDGVGLQKLTFQFPLKKKQDFKAVFYRYKNQCKSFWTADFHCQAGGKKEKHTCRQRGQTSEDDDSTHKDLTYI